MSFNELNIIENAYHDFFTVVLNTFTGQINGIDQDTKDTKTTLGLDIDKLAGMWRDAVSPFLRVEI